MPKIKSKVRLPQVLAAGERVLALVGSAPGKSGPARAAAAGGTGSGGMARAGEARET